MRYEKEAQHPEPFFRIAWEDLQIFSITYPYIFIPRWIIYQPHLPEILSQKKNQKKKKEGKQNVFT